MDPHAARPARTSSRVPVRLLVAALSAAGLAAGVCLGNALLPPSATPATARQSDMRAARTQYPGIVGSAIDNCALCHVSASDFRLDPYGTDWHEAAGDFGAIEGMDSDGDGYSNIEEITALTYPGKADSAPTPGASITPSTEPTATLTAEPTVSPTTAPTLEMTQTATTPGPTATSGPSPTPKPPPPAVFLPVTWRR